MDRNSEIDELANHLKSYLNSLEGEGKDQEAQNACGKKLIESHLERRLSKHREQAPSPDSIPNLSDIIEKIHYCRGNKSEIHIQGKEPESLAEEIAKEVVKNITQPDFLSQCLCRYESYEKKDKEFGQFLNQELGEKDSTFINFVYQKLEKEKNTKFPEFKPNGNLLGYMIHELMNGENTSISRIDFLGNPEFSSVLQAWIKAEFGQKNKENSPERIEFESSLAINGKSEILIVDRMNNRAFWLIPDERKEDPKI